MIRLNKIWLILILFSFYILDAQPLRVDELFTKKHSFRLETSLYYANIQRRNNTVAPVIVGSGLGTYPVYTIPAIINTAQTNQDYLNLAFSARYGITENLEIFASPSFFYQYTNTSDTGFSSQNSYDFNNFNMGLIYQIKKEGKYPSLFIGATPVMIEKVISGGDQSSQIGKMEYFKNYSFFATSYYSVDPIVFLVQGGFRMNLERKFEGHRVKMGNVFSLSPMVYFAINPYVSINFGIRYEYKLKDRIDGKTVLHQGSYIGYLFGVSYEVNPDLMVSIDANNIGTNAYDVNSINLLFSYKVK